MGTITVSSLGKAYKQYPTRWGRLAEWLIPRHAPRHTLKWVLKDINFTINAGEAVGIIGVNGAGKSTLLKIITGTTRPTSGTVHIQGRVAALLELGMGFHPDFTGRQNALMAGQLIGYSADEVTNLMDEIEAFAGIGEYIDQPVRIYSSGMQVRLAFAVSTAIRPDVLIIDEALSVGDAAFQRKCFQRIEAFRAAGTTLLFVSHDIETVKKLCDRALFIKDGTVAQLGSAKQVCDEYERFLFGDTRRSGATPGKPVSASDVETARFDPALVASCEVVYGNGKADIEACWLADVNGRRINVVESGTSFTWCYRVRFNEDVEAPVFAMMLKTREGVALYGIDSKRMPMDKKEFLAGDVLEVVFTLDNPLAPGVYYLNCGVRLDGKDDVQFLSRRIDAGLLRVIDGATTSVVSGLLEMRGRMTLATARAIGA